MSLRARKPVILVFILGALALGAIMVYFFGGREKFSRHVSFLMYFDRTVNGLGPGSLVRFKGVPIGVVESVHLGLGPAGEEQRVPVVIQLNVDRLQRQLGVLEDLSDPAVLASQVRRGLRAQLQTDKYTTGSMFVELEYFPNQPPPATTAPVGGWLEIPTIPSRAVAGVQKIQDIALWLPTYDFQAELGRVSDYLDTLGNQVSVIPFAEYHQKVMRTLTPLADFNLGPPQRNFTNFLARLNDYHDRIALANDQFSTSARDFVTLNHAARDELQQVNDALAQTRDVLNPAAPWLNHLTHNLQALSSDMANLTAKLNATEQQPDVLAKIPK